MAQSASLTTVAARPIGRLLRSDDFKRLLATPSKARSPHFVVHHLPQLPSVPARRLSTNQPGDAQPLVDKHALEQSSQASHLSYLSPVSPVSAVSSMSATRGADAVDGVWLGCVVPKKHARRAVTRNLLRRQIRQVAQDMAPALQGGLWLVRMRLGFDRATYPSAASQPLKDAAREELQRVLMNARAAVEGRRTAPRDDGRSSR